jgi:hypothetical protein
MSDVKGSSALDTMLSKFDSLLSHPSPHTHTRHTTPSASVSVSVCVCVCVSVCVCVCVSVCACVRVRPGRVHEATKLCTTTASSENEATRTRARARAKGGGGHGGVRVVEGLLDVVLVLLEGHLDPRHRGHRRYVHPLHRRLGAPPCACKQREILNDLINLSVFKP